MKKIVTCADGTWQSPESDCATHILRVARGIHLLTHIELRLIQAPP